MALQATVYRWTVTLSDVDRQVYETLDLRLARHPSESMRYLVTRVLAYALSYEEGIAFSRGGLSDADEPPVSIFDPTGLRTAWIDVGTPSAERLHKASKATPRVRLFTHAEPEAIQREAERRTIHRADAIEVWHLGPTLLASLEERLDRNETLELTRSDGALYVATRGVTLEGTVSRGRLG